MTDVDRVPACGGGSCARCRRALDLASVKHDGLWYCTATCAEGGAVALDGDASVPEAALYARPRRHFRKRLPKELNASAVRRTPPGGNQAAGTQ